MSDDFISAFKSNLEGKLFLKNLLHCWNDGLVQHSIEISALFKQACVLYKDKYGIIRRDNWLDPLIDACDKRGGVTFWCCAKTKPLPLPEVCRVISGSDLIWEPTWSLLSPAARSAHLLARNYRRTPSFFQRVEKLRGMPDTIRPGAKVRGRRPFSWVTTASSVESARRRHAASPRHSPSSSLAADIRDQLAVDFPHDGEPLFALHFPRDVLGVVEHARPTAIEGAGAQYFRSRHNDRRIPLGWGATINVRAFAAALRDDVGLPEIVVQELDFSRDFRWNGLGNLEDPLPDTRARLTTEAESEQLDEACEIVRNLLT